MKIKLIQILEAKGTLEKIFNSKLPIKTAFKLSFASEELNRIIDKYENMRIKKILELGEKQADGTYKVKPENEIKFQEDMRTLMDEEIDINIEQIEKDELEGINLSANEISKIRYLIR
ncbi:MAG: hypothetical protein AMXMBFR51_21170 [Ignavibacteriota bacterium]